MQRAGCCTSRQRHTFRHEPSVLSDALLNFDGKCVHADNLHEETSVEAHALFTGSAVAGTA